MHSCNRRGKHMLKLKLNSTKIMENQEISSAQKELKRPIFADSDENSAKDTDTKLNFVDTTIKNLRYLCDVKYNFNTISEGLSLAKGSRVLPPYMDIRLNFTPRLMQHKSKDIIKESVRSIEDNLRQTALSNLSETIAKRIREVAKEIDDLLESADTELFQAKRYVERNEILRKAIEMKEEYIEKLRVYKDSLSRRPRMTIRPKGGHGKIAKK